ncbi:uncharacterized protein LOC141632378 [Silene latifolia]|uniref:uncharacterized protein LOC141632378 n=1 Tax=Silene latifolia TaxID=37657 RepID=UPI003D787B84
MNAVRNVYQTRNLIKQSNNTIITLVPKVDIPETVMQYRPIAYCNTLYKCISKVICNRLSTILPDIVSTSQGTFIKGRDIVGNILILEWAFVNDLLKALGFPAQFIKLVMNCVTSPSYSIALNGEVFGFFKGRRDDLIMFCTGDKGFVELLIHAYDLFSRASGLVMNKGKSNIYFNGVSEGIIAEIEVMSGMKRGTIPFRYLGVTVSPKRLSVMDCNCLVEKVVGENKGKFLWHGQETRESPALVSWDLICRPKRQGGLRLKNLHLWNIAAIGKYMWWIESKEDHLWVKWVHAV